MYDDADDQGYQDYPSRRGRRGGGVFAAFVTSLLTTVAVFFGLRELEARGYLPAKGGAPAAGVVEVPSVVGVRLEQARDLLKGKGLLMSISEEREDPKAAAGTVIKQNPLAGSETAAGTTVQVVLARAVSTVLVPALAGLKPDEAARQLTAKGLVLAPQKIAATDAVAPGVVAQTEPAAGTPVAPGGAVALVLAAAPGKPVPKVTGIRLPKAKKLLEAAGFKVGKTTFRYDPCCGEYIILDQSPDVGAAAPAGTPIDLIVNEPG